MEPPIIHRDIKPENVVLKKAPKRVRYEEEKGGLTPLVIIIDHI